MTEGGKLNKFLTENEMVAFYRDLTYDQVQIPSSLLKPLRSPGKSQVPVLQSDESPSLLSLKSSPVTKSSIKSDSQLSEFKEPVKSARRRPGLRVEKDYEPRLNSVKRFSVAASFNHKLLSNLAD